METKMPELRTHERIFLYAIRSKIFAIVLFILLFSLFAIQIVEDVRMILPLLLPVNMAIAMLISYFRPTYCIIFDSETGKYSVKKC